MKKKSPLLVCIPTALVLVLSFLLLTYVGYGETSRTYPDFQIRKLATQGEIIKNVIAPYLRAGLPLEQFSGFGNLSRGLLLSDPGIENIRILNPEGKIVFLNMQKTISEEELKKLIAQRIYRTNGDFHDKKGYTVEESDSSFLVKLVLKSKIGAAGSLIIESKKEAIFSELNKRYKRVFISFGVISFIFVIFVFAAAQIQSSRRNTILKAVFIIGFLSMSAIIAVTVFQIYEYGAKANTKALSDSMAERLRAINELGIDINDIDGINDAFLDYKESNPHISAIALIENNIATFHTDSKSIGKPYTTVSNCYEYVVPLNAGGGADREFRVAVTVPVDIVMNAVKSSAKNFIVLFIACGLVALIFLDAGTGLLSVNGKNGKTASQEKEKKDDQGKLEDEYFQIGLKLIKPAYFLIVFVNAMSVSFLPQLVTKMAAETGSSIATASLPFTIYYFLFASVLIPAGQYAEKGSLKKLMGCGFLTEVIGLFLVAVTDNYWLLIVGRASSGIGQGFFLIGLQSYLLVVTPEDKRTQGAAVKVIGRNSGLIAGSAIGALLYAYMDYQRLFMLSSVLSLVGFVYLLKLVPAPESIKPAAKEKPAKKFGVKTNQVNRRSGRRIFNNVLKALKDMEFVKALTLIGLVGKIGITGVVMFAVPLVMSKQKYATEDIGQVLMLYYISSMIVTYYASRIVDGIGATRPILFASAVAGGLGMFFFGFTGASQLGDASFFPGFSLLNQFAVGFHNEVMNSGIAGLQGYIIIFCLMLMGASNGLLAAPVLTHINKTEIAAKYGNKSITATYIFLERIGHVVGPLIISQFFIFTDQSNLAITLFGIFTVITGLIFVVISKK